MSKMSRFTYNIHENIARNVIFIDGILRSGKKVLSGIISSLEAIEHTRVLYLLDQIIPAISFGSIDVQYARALLRTVLNEEAYNTLLARDTNFRYTDETGVLNYKEPSVYFQRLGRQDGDGIVEELRTKKIFFPFITHNLLVKLEYLDMLDIDYHMLALLRNPLDISYSRWVRGYAERFGKDPRAFAISIKFNGRALPWFCAGYEEEWLSLNPMERCILPVIHEIKEAVQQYKKAKDKSRIHLLTFEDFVQNPQGELEKICTFLHTKPTGYTANFISLANCPRKLNPAEKKRKMQEFKLAVRKKYFDMLMKMSKAYEANLYGLR